jgi:nicotinamidase-related amidase
MNALILIDIQKGLVDSKFYGDHRNNPDAEKNCNIILEKFRELKKPIFHVKHNSENPDSPLYPKKTTNSINDLVKPINGEMVFEKNVNSCFFNQDLIDSLNSQNLKKIVIVGLTTEHCISTSVRMGANLGFDITLISDATAAYSKVGINGELINAETVHTVELANLKDEFANIINSGNLLKKL